MKEKLIRKWDLKNGLTVHLKDASKKIADDLWQVSLNAHMEIPVNDTILGPVDGGQIKDTTYDLKEVKELMGDTVTFEKNLKRNFIADDEKSAILEAFISSLSRISNTYLDRPDFAKNYILKKYKEKQQRQTWYR